MSPPSKQKNLNRRSREYLAPPEIERIRRAARTTPRHGHRNDTLILMMFRHALRVSEAIALRWEQVNLQQGLLYVRRVKAGLPATHPLQAATIRALRRLQRLYPDTPYLFSSERQTPLTSRTVHHIIAQAGQQAGLSFPIHPHMLRHSTGFYLANKGLDTRSIQAYMGHASINNTVIYTALDAGRFNGFWNE